LVLAANGAGRPAPLLRCGRDQVGRGAGVKAVVYDRYGSPDVLRGRGGPCTLARRRPGAGEDRRDLSRPHRLGVPARSPAYARFGGLRFPARRTLGSDIASVVDDVGEGVTRFGPGDEVYMVPRVLISATWAGTQHVVWQG
jgi:hypothetical protein